MSRYLHARLLVNPLKDGIVKRGESPFTLVVPRYGYREMLLFAGFDTLVPQDVGFCLLAKAGPHRKSNDDKFCG